MNKFQEKIKNAANAMANNMVAKEAREWPPACLFFAYQPMRPNTQNDLSQEETETNHK